MGNIVKQLGSIDRQLGKKDIQGLAEENARAIIESGKYDILKVYVELKRYEVYLKSLIQNLKESAFEKANETGQPSFGYNYARISLSARTKWDFSVDQKWTELENQIQTLTKERKDREKYLKESNQMDEFVDEETGEIREAFELPKEIKYGLTVRL
ncbi:hypothetical protein [Membranihabitans marinus]|uniref:hypothetical protein n=1 Tax=Membranihabitans marinus TaxID=1227546 RepID=UPI001F3263D3|nr:hypothetical protein [Membranihabitans marinus]